jgi:hypothetical protein
MIRWLWAFVDRPLERFEEGAAFWSTVTETRLSARRGVHDEFATLLPVSGDACLKFQGVFEGGGAHLDLEAEDFAATLEAAQELGASLVDRGLGSDWALLTTPGGQAFCLAGHSGRSRKPAPVSEPGGESSRLDQVCLDIPPSLFDAELRFWSALTGWEARPGRFDEFHYLAAPPELPVRILLQRLAAERPGPPTAHPDFACSDVAAIRSRHEGLGAHFVAEGAAWTVMRDPVGGVYCLTGRDPVTGTLPQ